MEHFFQVSACPDLFCGTHFPVCRPGTSTCPSPSQRHAPKFQIRIQHYLLMENWFAPQMSCRDYYTILHLNICNHFLLASELFKDKVFVLIFILQSSSTVPNTKYTFNKYWENEQPKEWEWVLIINHITILSQLKVERPWALQGWFPFGISHLRPWASVSHVH